MKNKSTKLLSIISTVFIACIFFSCCKDKTDDGTPVEQLPPETQEGKNTFACLWNGQVWVARGSISISALQGDYANGEFALLANNVSSSISQCIGFQVEKNFYQANYFLLKFDNDSLAWGYCSDRVSNCSSYTDTIDNTGHLIITKFDTVNRIISGTFDMNITPLGCDEINITQGRFDIRYPI